jgi:hypothetical protein
MPHISMCLGFISAEGQADPFFLISPARLRSYGSQRKVLPFHINQRIAASFYIFAYSYLVKHNSAIEAGSAANMFAYEYNM